METKQKRIEQIGEEMYEMLSEGNGVQLLEGGSDNYPARSITTYYFSEVAREFLARATVEETKELLLTGASAKYRFHTYLENWCIVTAEWFVNRYPDVITSEVK